LLNKNIAIMPPIIDVKAKTNITLNLKELIIQYFELKA